MTSHPVRLLCMGGEPALLHTRCAVLRHAAHGGQKRSVGLLAQASFTKTSHFHLRGAAFYNTVDNL
jgi:hypothetical protein